MPTSRPHQVTVDLGIELDQRFEAARLSFDFPPSRARLARTAIEEWLASRLAALDARTARKRARAGDGVKKRRR